MITIYSLNSFGTHTRIENYTNRMTRLMIREDNQVKDENTPRFALYVQEDDVQFRRQRMEHHDFKIMSKDGRIK